MNGLFLVLSLVAGALAFGGILLTVVSWKKLSDHHDRSFLPDPPDEQVALPPIVRSFFFAICACGFATMFLFSLSGLHAVPPGLQEIDGVVGCLAFLSWTFGCIGEFGATMRAKRKGVKL
ncbi:MAG: hypothetical protein RLZZ324_1030 [Candidatus Parcubacteria bacterium]|jgi:RsiW-degrading membrane proteinase PrsW (M82 family)